MGTLYSFPLQFINHILPAIITELTINPPAFNVKSVSHGGAKFMRKAGSFSGEATLTVA
jgi:hypothetical protein